MPGWQDAPVLQPAGGGKAAWQSAPLVEAAAPSFAERAAQVIGNLFAGGVRGAGSIGATGIDAARDLGAGAISAAPPNMRPDVTAGASELPRGEELRSGMDAGLQQLGADPNSLAFKGGKLGGEVLGTLGVGGALGGAAQASGMAAPVVEALASGGMRAGGLTGLPGIVARAAGGAINGGASVGMVNPGDAGKGAAIGAVLPGAAQGVAALAGAGGRAVHGSAERLMQSAIKPTLAQRQSGDAKTAIDVLFEKGLSPNAAGVAKLREMIDGLDTQLSGIISNSPAMVDKQNVLSRLAPTRNAFTNQVSPTADLAAIQRVGDDFLSHPAFPLPQTQIPIQAAQDLKTGTYGVLAKKYGQLGSAETEAQKALARGLKEEIAVAEPAVAGVNAEMSRLITTLNVAERRALLEMNKNPAGLSLLAKNPLTWATFMADRSAGFKALAARMMNASAGGATGVPALPNSVVEQLQLGMHRTAPVLATQE